MNMKTNKIIVIFTLVVTISMLSGCSLFIHKEPLEPTPNIPNYGEFPVYSFPFSYSHYNCSYITENRAGYTWHDLQIGVTSFDEVVEILEPDSVEWDSEYGNMVFRIEQAEIRMCFINNTLSSIMLYRLGEGKDYIDDYFEIFGKPDVITWGNSSGALVSNIYQRTAIWLEEGLIASIGLDEVHFGELEGWILIPPIYLPYEKSWLNDVISIKPPSVTKCSFTEDVQSVSDLSILCCEDPFLTEIDQNNCGVLID